MIPMIAQASYRHKGKLYRIGGRFQVDTEQEARELVAVGFATRADIPAIEQPRPPAKAAPGEYERRDLRAKS